MSETASYFEKSASFYNCARASGASIAVLRLAPNSIASPIFSSRNLIYWASIAVLRRGAERVACAGERSEHYDISSRRAKRRECAARNAKRFTMNKTRASTIASPIFSSRKLIRGAAKLLVTRRQRRQSSFLLDAAAIAPRNAYNLYTKIYFNGRALQD